MTSKKNAYYAFVALVVFFCAGIGFVSVSRAGLTQTKPKLTNHEYRNMAIALKPVYADELAESAGGNYNLPEPGMLPTNPFYGFKALRDWLWLKITVDPVEKAKLYQYMADKKMSEALALIGESKTKDAYIALEESFGHLGQTMEAIQKIDKNKEQANQLRLHAIDAGRAYAMIVGNFSSSVTNSEYDRKQEWLSRLAEWNAKFEEEED